MHVIIKKNQQLGSELAATYIAQKINNAPKSRPFVLGLPTGSTPLETYRKLIEMNKAGLVSFENVVTFNMDEYVGLEATHEQSYHYFMYKNFFNHIDIKKENIHILNGMATDLQKECDNYETAIQSAGGIDLFLGGVGEDGHIAFNEPFTSLSSTTHIQALTRDTIRVNARFFGGDISQVPTHALTVGVKTITDAKEVLILAFGAKKAKALHHGIEGAVSHVWTLSALQMHKNSTIICDEDATTELSDETKHYFSGLA